MARREDVGSFVEEMPSTAPKVQKANGATITHEGDETVVDLDPREDDEPFRAPEMDSDWHANLADQLSPTQRHGIAQTLIEYVDIDKQVREHHFRRIKDGLELLGLQDLPDSDTPFSGAATVTDPLIGEAVVQFQSRAIEELFPAGGPVKAQILGEIDDEKQRQADRLEDYMNYQLRDEDQGYFWDVDQMLFYLPLSGSAFKKVYIDPITEMTTARYVTAEDFIVPYYAKDLEAATRYAHEYTMQGNDIKRAQVDGQFLEDAMLIPSPQILPDTATSFADDTLEDVADDRTPVVHEDDDVYRLYEYHVDHKMPFEDPEVDENDTDIAPPYIITIEEESREVLSVRRNWRKGDRKYRKRIWFSHYKFLPGLGFYGFGYLHIIGSLAKAASGSLRALLDTAALSNLPGGFKSKKAKIAGEHRFTLGEFKDVDMPPENLKEAFLPLPVKEPSPALATLYETLVSRGKEFTGTTEVITGEADNRGPVGTTLALIEQAGKPQSAIHKRLHKAMGEELKLMAELNYELMDRHEYPYEVGGEKKVVLKEDFDGRVDVIPVSDPNIFSSVQRIAQSQGVLELVESAPDLYGEKGRREAHRRMLEALKVPEIDVLLPEKEDKNLDPVSENQYMATGTPVQVVKTQDDQAHIAVHQEFAEMLATGDPELWAQVEPVFMAHKMDHLVNQYRKDVEAMLGMELPPFDLYDESKTEDLPPEVEVMISQAVAARQRQMRQEQEAARGGPPLSPEEAEAKAVEDAKDAETIDKLERMQAEHREKQRMEREKFEDEERRKREAFEAEERRKDEANEADIEREKKLAAAKRKALVSAPASRSRAAERETNRKPKKKQSDGEGASAS